MHYLFVNQSKNFLSQLLRFSARAIKKEFPYRASCYGTPQVSSAYPKDWFAQVVRTVGRAFFCDERSDYFTGAPEIHASARQTAARSRRQNHPRTYHRPRARSAGSVKG